MRRITRELTDWGFHNKERNDFNVLMMKHILTNPKCKGWYCGSKSQSLDYRTKKKAFLWPVGAGVERRHRGQLLQGLHQDGIILDAALPVDDGRAKAARLFYSARPAVGVAGWVLPALMIL